MNRNTTMDISIGNALCSVVQFLDPFILKLFVGCLLCHPLQHPVDIRSCLVILMTLVVGIILEFTADRLRHRLRLMKRNASAFLFRSLLLIAGRGILILICLGFRIGLGRIRIFTCFFSFFPRLIFFILVFCAGQSPCFISCLAVIGDPAAFFRSGNRRTITLTCFAGAFDTCQESGKNVTGGGAVTCCCGFVLLFLTDVKVFLDIGPTPDHNEADDLPAFLGIGGCDRSV